MCGDEAAVYADRAYESKIRRKWLKSQGIKDPAPIAQAKSMGDWRRKLVEKVFGTLKRSYGYSRVRYKRNAVEMWFKLNNLNARYLRRESSTTGLVGVSRRGAWSSAALIPHA